MKRVLFDTNIYGRMVEKAELAFIAENSGGVMVNYGSVVVRQELRAYHGKGTLNYGGKLRKFRALLLEAYDSLVRKTYEVDEKTDRLAEEYFIAYKKFGGSRARDEILNDFLIVATASIHELDIVYTEEREGIVKTMRSPEALKAYELVNELNGLRLPQFKCYEELKATLKSKRWFA